MTNQDRLASIMDGIIAQHYQYIDRGYLSPRWMGGNEVPTRRLYNMPDESGKPYVSLAISLEPDEQELGADEFEKAIRSKIRLLGPAPSKAEWESKKLTQAA